MKEIMTPKHRRWHEFCAKLVEGVVPCDCSAERPFATRILKTMPEIDIEKTFEYFDKYEGTCDCMILRKVTFNTMEF